MHKNKLILASILSLVFICNCIGGTNQLEFVLHFEAGNNGDDLTTNLMTNCLAATKNFRGSVSLATNHFVMSSEAMVPGNRWYVNETNSGQDNLGLRITMHTSTGSGHSGVWNWQGNWSNIICGFYFHTTLTSAPPGVNSTLDLVYVEQPFSGSGYDTACALFCPQSTPTWRAHGLSSDDPTFTILNGPDIPVDITKTNWVVMKCTPSEYKLSIFDISTWSEIGSSSVHQGGAGKLSRIEILDWLRNYTPSAGQFVYIDQLMISTNIGLWPMLPTNTGPMTIIESDLSWSSIQTIVTNSTNGDIILLPPGVTNWASTLMWSNKAITVAGAGMNSTIITNTQNNAPIGSAGGAMQTFQIWVTTNGPYRLSNIGFDGHGTNNQVEVYQPNTFVFSDPWPVIRIDRCGFYNSPRTGCLLINALAACVIDHCMFVNNDVPLNVYAGGSQVSDSWANNLSLGTTNCVVTEDCYFVNSAAYLYVSSGFISTRGQGCRDTFRYNVWSNTYNQNFAMIDVHGDLGTPNIGTRQFECYSNIFAATSGTCLKQFDIRGGTCMIFNNIFYGSMMTTNFYAREEDEPVFGFPVTYPGYDQHWLWLWNDVSKGIIITNLQFGYPATDPKYLIDGTNVFWTPPSISTPPITSYTPLSYPHPLVVYQDGLNNPKCRILGKAIFRGKATIR